MLDSIGGLDDERVAGHGTKVHPNGTRVQGHGLVEDHHDPPRKSAISIY
jgi:hypothetical protein